MLVQQTCRSTMKVVVAMLLMFVSVVVLPELVLGGDSSKKVGKWITTHASDLPTTLDGLLAIPAPYRSDVLRALGSDAHCAMWRAQYERLLQQRLTKSQAALVNRMLDLLTPELYRAAATGLTSPELRQMKALCTEARVLFAS